MPKKSSVIPPKTFWTKNSRGEEVSISLPPPHRKLPRGQNFALCKKIRSLRGFSPKLFGAFFYKRKNFDPFKLAKKIILDFFSKDLLLKKFHKQLFWLNLQIKGSKG